MLSSVNWFSAVPLQYFETLLGASRSSGRCDYSAVPNASPLQARVTHPLNDAKPLTALRRLCMCCPRPEAHPDLPTSTRTVISLRVRCHLTVLIVQYCRPMPPYSSIHWRPLVSMRPAQIASTAAWPESPLPRRTTCPSTEPLRRVMTPDTAFTLGNLVLSARARKIPRTCSPEPKEEVLNSKLPSSGASIQSSRLSGRLLGR